MAVTAETATLPFELDKRAKFADKLSEVIVDAPPVIISCFVSIADCLIASRCHYPFH